jgi:hypothetical protein
MDATKREFAISQETVEADGSLERAVARNNSIVLLGPIALVSSFCSKNKQNPAPSSARTANDESKRCGI